MSGMKNLIVMGGAMMAVRRLDQDDTETILMTRLVFALYVLVCCVVNLMLHVRVVEANDKTSLIVPPPPPSPFAPPKPPSSDDDPSESDPSEQRPDVITTVMAYDLSALANARKSWLFNAVIVTAIHAKTGAVNPLIMSAVMGFSKIFDEPLFKIHYLRMRAEGPLKRPFEPEKNPLATMLQGMLPPPPGTEGASEVGSGQGDEGTVGMAGRPNGSAKNGSEGLRRRTVSSPVEVEELCDDGDDEEEDERPLPVGTDDDRPEDDDFADDDNKDSKKSK